MKRKFLLYEVINTKTYELRFIDSFPARIYAQNKMLEFANTGRIFVIQKTYEP